MCLSVTCAVWPAVVFVELSLSWSSAGRMIKWKKHNSVGRVPTFVLWIHLFLQENIGFSVLCCHSLLLHCAMRPFLLIIQASTLDGVHVLFKASCSINTALWWRQNAAVCELAPVQEQQARLNIFAYLHRCKWLTSPVFRSRQFVSLPVSSAQLFIFDDVWVDRISSAKIHKCILLAAFLPSFLF